jgi:Tfp pilus assembly protein PilN
MRWHFCNVLDVGANTRRVWQFDARTESFNLSREQTARDGEQLPPNLVAKSWGTLFKTKLNVAWLPPENVFLRAAQFPLSTPEETRSMVELQLEKLSPIPVTQALWTMNILPPAAPAPGGEGPNLQTIVIVVVSRDVVEEFLGKLEGQGYLADRLELPMLDQLQATRVVGDGAWVYPEGDGPHSRALVAWWYGGTLHNLDLLAFESGPNRIASLKDQLVQMTWAGELEGWLTSAPRWHLVGNESSEWHSALREALEQPFEVIAPVPLQELAARTAKRAAQGEGGNNLLPPEFATRYQQQFVDRLWGRGLLAALGVYFVCLAIYFIALMVLSQLTSRVEAQAADISGAYTNSIQRAAMLNVLKDRENLKFAALDCWEGVAETMPAGLTLEVLNFNDGKTLSLRGTAPTDQVTAVTDFFDSLRKWKKNGRSLFVEDADAPRTSLNAGGAAITWSFELELKQTEK